MKRSLKSLRASCHVTIRIKIPMYTVSATSVIRHFQHSRTFHFSIPKEKWHAKVRRDFGLVIFNTEACVREGTFFLGGGEGWGLRGEGHQ